VIKTDKNREIIDINKKSWRKKWNKRESEERTENSTEKKWQKIRLRHKRTIVDEVAGFEGRIVDEHVWNVSELGGRVGVVRTDEVAGFEGRIEDDDESAGFESEAYEIDRSRNKNWFLMLEMIRERSLVANSSPSSSIAFFEDSRLSSNCDLCWVEVVLSRFTSASEKRKIC
jgi:hypothetical protein